MRMLLNDGTQYSLKRKYNMKKNFTLIGHHLTHSISPLIQNTLFSLSGYDGEYDITEIAPEDIPKRLPEVIREFDGFNITIPHKVVSIPFLDELSPEAKKLGSVNTVVKQNGKVVGHNTDYFGFTRALEKGGLAADREVLLLGSGGVCKTFAHALCDMGAHLTIAARNAASSAELADEIEAAYNVRPAVLSLEDTEAIKSLDNPLIVNGTPVGMFPKVGVSPISEEAVKDCSGVFDAIYNPSETELLRIAAKHGIHGENGLWMLILQAVKAQELWTGCTFTDSQLDIVAKACEKELEKRNNS